jgi:nucleoid-associated protein YgaU
MKKTTLFIAIAFTLASIIPVFAISYDNNEFQQKSRAYTNLAAKAYDEGDYDAAAEYARKAEENAALSSAFIQKMIARADAQTILYTAHTRLTWAQGLKAEKYFPGPFANATAAVKSGDDSFAAEDYVATTTNAQKAIDELSSVREIIPLPAEYKVERWLSTKDCLWNIAANPAIYGDPFLWDKLYAANKASLVQPSNPNLVKPGQIIKIPSIGGEYREGRYDPSVKYESYESQTKK